MAQWKRETVKNQPVVGAVREPPLAEQWPFLYQTASYEIRVLRDGVGAYCIRLCPNMGFFSYRTA